jgi:fimbrial chaperone protein
MKRIVPDALASLRGAVMLALLCALPARAASLQVSPVLLEFQQGQAATGVTLRNESDEPLNAQVRVFAWSQQGGEDRLSAQQALVPSPPIVSIPAHGEQLVRVVRVSPQAVAAEQSFRLLADELPAGGAANGNSINIRLRYSIPVFLLPGGFPAAPELRWSLQQHDDAWFLVASNRGGRRAQLSRARLLWSDGRSVELTDGLLGYALAGSGRAWRLPQGFDNRPGTGLQVEATLNGSPARAPVETPGH